MNIDDRNICSIVNDLLPLYADDACTDESKKMVEEHIAECAECRRTLQAMQEPVSVSEAKKLADEFSDFKFIKSIGKASRKTRIRTLIAVILVIAILSPFVYLTANQLRNEGLCFTNYDDIKAANELMEIWKTQGIEAAFDKMDATALYNDFQKYGKAFPNDPNQNFFAIDVNGETCYFNNHGEYVDEESVDARLKDTEFMNDFWYNVITNTIWEYVIPATEYEQLEQKYGDAFYKKGQENANLPYDYSRGVPKKIETQFGDFYYNSYDDGSDEHVSKNSFTADFREKIKGANEPDELFPLAAESDILPAEIYDYCCEEYKTIDKWQKAYADYYEKLGADGFNQQWKENLLNLFASPDYKGFEIVDYKLEYVFGLNYSGAWVMSYDVTFSNGETGIINIQSSGEFIMLSGIRSYRYASIKMQYLINKIAYEISDKYYSVMSFDEYNW